MKIAIDPAGAVPDTLTALPQWVCWRPLPDRTNPDGKPKKCPIDAATGKAASSTDPATWGTFEEAQALLARRPVLAGLGFVFAIDGGLVGIDLDGCLDAATGEVVVWAADWLARLLAVGYAEVSPSGAGVKVWVRGRIPRALSLKNHFGPGQGIEIYAEGRYFTVTGQVLAGCAGEPGDAQAILDELFATFDAAPALPELGPAPDPPAPGWRQDRARAVDDKLKAWVGDCRDWAAAELMATQPGGLHNRRLQLGRFLGGVVAAAPQHLSAEEALHVLYGAKLPASHHRDELKAIRDGITTGMREPLTPGAVGDQDGRDYLPTDQELVSRAGHPHCPRCGERVRRSRFDYAPGQPPGWYCPRCAWPMQWPLAAWAGGELAATGAAGGAIAGAHDPQPSPVRTGEVIGKAYRFLVGAAIDTIAMPRWLIRGYMALGAVTIVWGASESGKTPLLVDIAERVAQHHPVIYVAAEDAAGLRARMRAWELHHQTPRGAFIVVPEALDLSDDAAVDLFIAQCQPYASRILFIDTLSPCIVGLDENSNSDMGWVALRLVRIALALDCHVAVAHHPTKDGGGLRGASALLNNTSAVWMVEKGGDDLITVRQTRNKQGGRRDDSFFRIVPREVDVVDDQGQPLTSVVLLPAQRTSREDMTITKAERDLLRMIADADAAGEPLTTAELMESSGYTRKTAGPFYRMLRHLKETCRYIEKATERARSPFTPTAAGKRVLAAEHLVRQTNPIVASPWEIAVSLDGSSTTPAPPRPREHPAQEATSYTAVDGYDDIPAPDAPSADAPPWAGDGGTEWEPEPEPGPRVVPAMVARIAALNGRERHAAD